MMRRESVGGYLLLILIGLLISSDYRYNSTPEGKREVQLRSIRNHVKQVERMHGSSPELKKELKEFEAKIVEEEMKQFLLQGNSSDSP